MSRTQLILPIFFLTVIILTEVVPVNGLGIGPPSLELTVTSDGFNTTKVYVTSDGLEGNLIIGSEGLPFRVEPETYNMTPEDVNEPLSLRIYGNETVEPGTYNGKITFAAITGGAVAMGIKIKVTVEHIEREQGLTFIGLSPTHQVLTTMIAALSSIILLKMQRHDRNVPINEK